LKPTAHQAAIAACTTHGTHAGRRTMLLSVAGLTAVWATGCQSPPQLAATAPAAGPWSARQKEGLQALGFEQVGDDWALNLTASLLFEFDSDQLKSQQRARLMVVGRELLTLEVSRLRIEGHTDSKGELAYNRSLALRRARTVAQTLANAGWSPQQLQAQGFGNERPIADNSTESGRAQNRRVVLIASAD
jgi:outer membrane protein OmpA-like peptidoglycan-associated protein